MCFIVIRGYVFESQEFRDWEDSLRLFLFPEEETEVHWDLLKSHITSKGQILNLNCLTSNLVPCSHWTGTVAAGLEGYNDRVWSPGNSSGRGKQQLYDMLLGKSKIQCSVTSSFEGGVNEIWITLKEHHIRLLVHQYIVFILSSWWHLEKSEGSNHFQ